ncbi:hypothetical protein, conserved [Eimeria necatrix]|uniref:Armadillo/beta-catenin-like repeat-containing protein n=1 Tax=Eimeria necatrix TaxID=51315 RepID=U6MKT7_9EIME|nr:hypothetical protein, conserved [Eimeria necatrix]CDJ63054.1 hypothetical protein, conserved [Eimeria necatrix]
MAQPGDGIDWPGLYRWSIKYSDGTSPQCRLKEEDIDFLRGAIQEAFKAEENPVEVIKEQMTIVNSFLNSQTKGRDCIAALSVVQRLIEDYPELSRDLAKLNALEPLLRLLSMDRATLAASGGPATAAQQQQQQQQQPQVLEESEAAKAFIILEKTLEILASVMQNNPQIQQAVAELGGLGVLFALVKESPRSKALRVRALQTLSCLLRNHRPSEETFLKSKGLTLLVYAIKSDDPKYQEKACSLCRHLVAEGLISFEQIKETGLLQALEMLLPTLQDLSNVQFAETALQLVIKILQQHRISLSRTADLASLTAALTTRSEWLSTALCRLRSEEEFLTARAALKLLTPQEALKLENIPYDREAVQGQMLLVQEALALTKVQHLIPSSQQQRQPQQQQQSVYQQQQPQQLQQQPEHPALAMSAAHPASSPLSQPQPPPPQQQSQQQPQQPQQRQPQPLQQQVQQRCTQQQQPNYPLQQQAFLQPPQQEQQYPQRQGNSHGRNRRSHSRSRGQRQQQQQRSSSPRPWQTPPT